ncbi:hypothetical protein CNMCM8927_009389 [Aspergillus lentulus]|uniref:Uncharacterized protein n=1 Tax=Aspergillus lentulus TaxID=293939 RepID=A0AAN6BML2_ASPLE|nr:hypothetical protein CNMCM8060_005359 [Aspergillus lentulus]KAF4199545.1 hypothetical protein CNMCM8694_003294 [Aspergillus lentulus]KAF4202948.1 hypothetical protein CNMCM8927_009389 [Aspergillus lentulus]
MPLLSSCHLLLRTILFLRPNIATGVSKRLHTAQQFSRPVQLGLATTVSNTCPAPRSKSSVKKLSASFSQSEISHTPTKSSQETPDGYDSSSSSDDDAYNRQPFRRSDTYNSGSTATHEQDKSAGGIGPSDFGFLFPICPLHGGLDIVIDEEMKLSTVLHQNLDTAFRGGAFKWLLLSNTTTGVCQLQVVPHHLCCVAYSAEGAREKDIYNYLNALSTRHQGAMLVRRALDTFQISSPEAVTMQPYFNHSAAITGGLLTDDVDLNEH